MLLIRIQRCDWRPSTVAWHLALLAVPSTFGACSRLSPPIRSRAILPECLTLLLPERRQVDHECVQPDTVRQILIEDRGDDIRSEQGQVDVLNDVAADRTFAAQSLARRRDCASLSIRSKRCPGPTPVAVARRQFVSSFGLESMERHHLSFPTAAD